MNETRKIKLELDVDQVNQILEALGALPFSQVYQLIGSIQQQAREQVAGAQQAGQEDEAE